MPVYVYWGDDTYSLRQAVRSLEASVLDPGWTSFNFDRLAPEDTMTGLNQAMTPPLGTGDRLVWLENTSVMNQCSDDLFAELERTLAALPTTTHLLLTASQKIDGRLKSTKLLKKVARVQEFKQLAPWDTDGLIAAVRAAAQERDIELSSDATTLLAEAVGTDRRRLVMELEKLALYAGETAQPVSASQVIELVPASASNSFQLAGHLRQGDADKALQVLTQLLDRNDPALKILAVLVGQFRTWLWVKLAIEAGERNNKAIAQSADIGNPNRVFFLQKEVKGLASQQFYDTLGLLLDLEYCLKRGQDSRRSFQTTCVQIAERFSRPPR